MLSRISTTTINTVGLIAVILLAIELLFTDGGIIFSLLFFAVLLFLGKKFMKRTLGKVVFWIGAVGLGLSALSTISVRFAIVAFLVLLLIQNHKKREQPDELVPSFLTEKPDRQREAERPLLKNRFLGKEKTLEQPYGWKHINITGGVGDRIIDTTNTVLPEEAVIVIRHGMGKVTIYVPYEVKFSLYHSTVFGHVFLPGMEKERLFNKSMIYHSEEEEPEAVHLQIFTSILSGDLEVKRR
ncbi:cell wall-active antibiotics response protein LiaF [Sinobaca sp. H24]|uniref:cell wall-active antibiotics response protein LiaF n=1 Tax=Sinobaca sp. H24 TaxID=2923376 RepID=UPI00207A4D16|nr:cell wall-active antibiotics response protein LiaF [Sinobaca sp. H24]